MAMLKRITTILMTILLILPNIVYASEATGIYAYLNGNTVVLGGVSPFGDEHTVTAKITLNDEVVYFKSMKSGENGTFEFECELDPAVNLTGIYNVTIGGAGLGAVSVPNGVEFLSNGDAEFIIEQIKDCNTSDDIEDALFTNADVIGINLSGEIDLIEDKKAVYSSLIDKDFNSFLELKKLLETSVAIQMFNESDSTDAEVLIQKYADLLGVDFDELFNELTESQKSDVYKNICGGNIELSAGTFKKTVNSAIYTSLINSLSNSNSELLITYVDTCNDLELSEFDIDTYENLTSKQKETFLENVIAKKNKEMFSDLSDVVTYFNSEVSEVKNKSEEKPKYSGGGSGGVSASVTVVTPSPSKDIQGTGVSVPKTEVTYFNDLESVVWAKDYINYLAENGIINGRAEGIYAPNDYVTREEFVKILVDAIKLPSIETEKKFDDISSEAWYYDYVMKAYASGIINGIDNRIFGVGTSITREQACTIIYRAMLYMDYQISVDNMQVNISDRDQISEYAIDAVNAMYRTGIVSGTGEGNFNPKGNATRAEIAKIICGVLERIGDL